MIRTIALALALGLAATSAFADDDDDDDKAKPAEQAKPAESKPANNALLQILDPAVHGLVRMRPLQLGTEEDSASMEPREYRLKAGQGYRWKIKASDLNEYALIAPAFFRNIWIRKVEAGEPEVEIKAAVIDEIEFENGGEAELFFVAIRPGTYEFGPRGMMERGVVGKIIVEGAGG
jgi:uncharacterized cupredoxin-like copper-binding protein